jgi:putative FmdB family regulatory protein
MPVYDYQCQNCGHIFTKLSRSMQSVGESATWPCPLCESQDTRRLLSRVAILGSLGGLTPGEQAAQNAQYERQSHILPKSKIDEFRAAKK